MGFNLFNLFEGYNNEFLDKTFLEETFKDTSEEKDFTLKTESTEKTQMLEYIDALKNSDSDNKVSLQIINNLESLVNNL